MSATVLTYEGHPSRVSALAQELQEHGLAVEYEPPLEHKDLALALSVVSVALSVTGPIPDLVTAVRAFTTRFPKARVTGLPEGGPSIRERLAELDALHAEGVITADELAEQRHRILNEL